jgi:hypothetical protein
VKRLLLVAAAAVLAGATAPGAGATRECDGLDVCIRVPGPWVAVPGTGSARVSRVEYQLTCPRGSIVGGLDAVLGDDRLDVVFLGTLGSPVNPGISTSRSVVFVVTYAGRAPTSFQPLIGCIPTSGGGGRGTTSVAAPAPSNVPVRRVRTFRPRPGAAQTFVLRCAAGERLVASSHAVGLRTRAEPSPSLLGGVSVTRREPANRVEIRVRRTGAIPPQVRAEVQVHALCAGGRP